MFLCRSAKMLFFILTVALCLFIFGTTAVASDLSTCVNCHNFPGMPNQDVTKFILPVRDDGSTTGTVANRLYCINCHRTNIGSIHSIKFSTVTVTVYEVVYGGFKSYGSFWGPASEIHPKHRTYRPTSSICQTCHGITSCQACHSPVAHDQHYLPQAVNPLTGKNIVTPSLYTTDGKTRMYRSTTCAVAECHQTLPSPQIKRTDGRDLCFNCHTTGTPGHVDAHAKHATTFVANPFTDCSECHKTDLVTEHAARTDDAGVSYDCYTCHKNERPDIKAAITGKNSKCDACHTNFDHLLKHESNTIDDKCGTCHEGNLVTEHLYNPDTQQAVLTCSTCHNSTDPNITYAVLTKGTNCTACHTSAHNMILAAPIPPDILLYPGYEWSAPQPADVWASETWMPAGYEGAKLLISNRRTDVTGPQIWDYYSQNLTSNGWVNTGVEWVVTATEPVTETNFFTAEFTKDKRKVTIFFYGGENHSATPVISSGYRLEILYK